MKNLLKFIPLVCFMFLIAACASATKSGRKGAAAQRHAAEEMALKQVARAETSLDTPPATAKPQAAKSQEPAAKIQEPAAKGQDMETPPEFLLQDIYQDLYSLGSYHEKQAVLLFFWTTWCPFCQQELKVLNDMYGEFTENGIEVFAINVGEFPEKVNTFVSGYFLAYRVLLDKDASVSKSFKVTGVPTYILINKKGKIVFRDNALPLKYKDLLPE